MSVDLVYLEIAILRKKSDPTGSKFLVVKSQPYIDHMFNLGSSFNASNGFTLSSSSCTEICGSEYLYVRGTNKEKHCQILEIREDVLNDGFLGKLRVAVAEYNIALKKRFDKIIVKQAPVNLIPDYSYEPLDIPNKRVVRLIL